MHAETNGPLAAREYRERNPQTAPQKPVKTPSHRTRMELFAGRLQVKLNELKNNRGPCANATSSERRAYEQWVRDFLEVCRG